MEPGEDFHPSFNSNLNSFSSMKGSVTSWLMEHGFRRLADEEETEDAPIWETVVVAVTLFVMFVYMLTDKIGPDWVMVAGLTLFMACEIVTVKEGLEGFANEGILTVMALFIVAEGVSRTGALDYYMGMLLGKPKTVAGAQLRLMIPIAALSAFLNNTPIVAVMIPLTLRWAKNIGVPRQQLLMPLSYATILGGTCTLVGTSTNLVVSGLLERDYPNDESGNIGLFDIAVYGVPNAIIGIAYMLVCGTFLLPNGGSSATGLETEDLLLGARVTPWSPAAHRTVMRSGLGNSGGIYLVNVRRAATGNIHRAVSKDFVISVGDELYFTASVDEFAAFCEKHGLEIITTENIGESGRPITDYHDFSEVGMTAADAMAVSETERLRAVNHLADQIDDREPVEPGPRPNTIVVTTDGSENGAILVGVDCHDRRGLVLDISTLLFEQGLKLHKSEAKVVYDRSLSVWRCGAADPSAPYPDLEEVWTALDKLVGTTPSDHKDLTLTKKKVGTRVVRAYITKTSSLIGKEPALVDFRKTYKAAIVAYQKNGRNTPMNAELAAGDLLVLETIEGTPLLTKPPQDFYNKTERGTSTRLAVPEPPEHEGSEFDVDHEYGSSDRSAQVWNDLKVVLDDQDDDLQAHGRDLPKGEFLTAFVVPRSSPLLGKSLNELGYTKLPGVVLVSIERPSAANIYQNGKDKESENLNKSQTTAISADDALQVDDVFWFSGSAEAIGDLRKIHGLVFYQEDEMKKAASSLQDRRLAQAVVARGSPLIGKTVKDVHFRSTYGGAVIAIQRGNERVHEHPGYVPLQTGDVLLVEAGPSFFTKHANNYRTFALLSEVENSSPPRPRLFLLCVVMIAASLAVAAFDVRALLITASLVGIVMVGLGIVTQQEARDALQWDLYLVVGAAFGVGNAMENSGVAEGVANFLVKVGEWVGMGGKHTSFGIILLDPATYFSSAASSQMLEFMAPCTWQAT
jgi:di/tricarboxylate transporter